MTQTHDSNRSQPSHPQQKRSHPATSPATQETDLTQYVFEEDQALTPDVILQLQATHGNHFVNRLIQRQPTNALEEELIPPAAQHATRLTPAPVPQQAAVTSNPARQGILYSMIPPAVPQQATRTPGPTPQQGTITEGPAAQHATLLTPPPPALTQAPSSAPSPASSWQAAAPTNKTRPRSNALARPPLPPPPTSPWQAASPDQTRPRSNALIKPPAPPPPPPPPGPEQSAPDSAPESDDDVSVELRELDEREQQVDETTKAGVDAAETFLGSKAKDIEKETNEQLDPEISSALKDEGLSPGPKDIAAVRQSIEKPDESDTAPPPSQEDVDRLLKEIASLALNGVVGQLVASSVESPPAKKKDKPKKEQLDKGVTAALDHDQREQNEEPLTVEPEHDSGLIDATYEFFSEAAGILGFVGTGGGTNFGLKPVIGSEDGPLETIADPFEYIFQFSQRAEGTANEDKTNETLGYMSGVSDAASGLLDGVMGARAVYKLVVRLREIKAEWKKPETTPARKNELRTEATIIGLKLSKLSVGFAQSGMVIAGGVTYATETAGKITSAVHDGTGVQSSPTFGFTKEGGNMLSTEFKLSGDIIGLLGTYIGGIIQGAELGSKIANGEFTKGTKKEVAGRIAVEVVKTIESAAKAGKSLGEIVSQISEGGQIVLESSKAVLGAMGQAIGGIGAGIALLDIARQGYLINKFRNRKKALKAAAVGLVLEENQQAALDFICATLTKRQKRAAREIFFDSLNVVGGVLTATGMGSAAGIAISATALTLKLGHAAFKFTRQKLRNYLAKKRAHLESYAEWAARQKAIKGGWAGKKAFMKRVFMPNWDKSTDKKAAEYAQHAQTVLGLLDQHPALAESALHGLGVATNKKSLAKFMNQTKEKKFKAIVDAMKKR